MSSTYTIGHSTHSLEEFLSLLLGQSIKAVADIRSAPIAGGNRSSTKIRSAGSSPTEGSHMCRWVQSSGAGETHSRRNEQGRILYRSIAAERRLLRLTGLVQPDLFRTEEEILAEAYERQEARIAHVAQQELEARVGV